MSHVVCCLQVIACQQERSQPVQMADVLHASDEIFAEIQRVKLEWRRRVDVSGCGREHDTLLSWTAHGEIKMGKNMWSCTLCFDDSE